MPPFAIRVENISKCYRIGLKEQMHDTFIGALTDFIRKPIENFRRLRLLTKFGDHELRSKNHEPTSDIIWALKDVSFEVKHGEVVGIIGRNGAGKTTLLKVLARITEPTSGRAIVNGRVGSLLEVGTGMHPELTGRENIYLSGTILGMTRVEVDRKFDEIVEFAELSKFIDTPVKRYSSGMKVRLGFAIAAHLEPEILLVDEVLAVGDAAFQKKCLGKMGEVAGEGRTVLFVSHNLGAILSLCEKCILLEEGNLRLADETVTVVSQYQSTTASRAVIPLKNRKDRRGNGSLRFTGLRIVGSDAKTGSSGPLVVGGQPVTIILEYVSRHGGPLKDVSIAFIVLDLTELRLFTCWTRFQDMDLKNAPPRGRLKCHIPMLPLAAGVYQINLWSSVEGELADYVKGAVLLDVVDRDFYGTGRSPVPRKHGPFLVEHFWELSDFSGLGTD